MTSSSYLGSDMSLALIKEIVSETEKIFISVSDILLKRSGRSGSSVKRDGTLVTDTDKLVEEKIIEYLEEKFPKLKIFGEESGYSEELEDICLLIDPIDGTSSFIKGIETFTVMAVLIINEKITASVIYNPSTEEMFTAIENNGAFKNGTKLNLNLADLPSDGYCKKKHLKDINEILNFTGIELVTMPSGAGYGFSKVAEGISCTRFQIKARGYIHDYAPGALLVSEAGGKIISFEDRDFYYGSRSFVACHPALESAIIKNLKQFKDLVNKY